MLLISFKRIPEDENNFYKYLWRIGSAIEDGTAGCTWSEAGPKINQEWGKSYTSSAYRKPIQYTIPFFNYVFSEMTGEEMSEEIKEQMDKMYKLKKQLSDQRREYNKILTKDARAEHLLEIVKDAADRVTAEDLTERNKVITKFGDDEAVLVLADWHYGMTADNIWNKFNTEICRDRVANLTLKTLDALKIHNVRKLHILCLGDFAHGACHVGCRVASDELVCDQLMQVSELLAGLIVILEKYVDEIEVYYTFGNHMRTVQNKAESIHDDNMEKIIPWYLKERFRNDSDVTINISKHNDIVLFDCCGYGIFATHGDIDKFDNIAVTANMLSTKAIGKNIDYVISADKHSSKEYDKFGVKAIQVACLCGTDEYAHNHRLYSEPGQTLLIFDKLNGRKCTYDITFSQF